jgi:hypothetical protein
MSISPAKICNLRLDTFALMMHMANISYKSRVLIIDNTKGFLSGALIERDVHSILRIEFGVSGYTNTKTCKLESEVLFQYNFPYHLTRKISYLHSEVITRKADPVTDALLKMYKSHFNSVIICDEGHHPLESYLLI